MMMTGGIGESAAPGDGTGEVWLEAQRLVAQARWRNENHTLSLASFENEIAGYEKVNAEFNITDLRWVISHIPFATPPLLQRLKAPGAGAQLTGWRYLPGAMQNNGSPFRMVMESGIRAGMHSDSVHISPLNPWLHIYYAVTGVNASGPAHQRWPADQPAGCAPALHSGKRLVPSHGGPARLDRTWKTGGFGGSQRRLPDRDG